jgi:hypothetical protein
MLGGKSCLLLLPGTYSQGKIQLPGDGSFFRKVKKANPFQPFGFECGVQYVTLDFYL